MLGGTDAGRVGDVDAEVVDSTPETLACPPINEKDYPALRGATCTGTCTDPIESPRSFAAPANLAAALAGRWDTCGATIGPADSVGLEFLPGCVLYFLVRASDGLPARGTEAAYQGTYDIVTSGVDVRGVVLHLATNDVRATASASGCLGRVRLTTPNGFILDLATLEKPDGSPAK